jgi:Ca-activated chloride channel family protein
MDSGGTLVRFLQDLHFLRPLWLLALLPGLWIAWSAWRRQDPAQAWQGVIDPALLEALLLRKDGERGALPPARLLGLGLVLSTLALAGPTWEQQPTPFAEDQAAVFIVLEVTPEMEAQDVAPSRLRRSVQKIGDFLDLRPGQRTGLVAFAGSPHLAMPLTSDGDIILDFAAALEPEVMPVPGDDPLAAIRLADQRLRRTGLPGSVVLIAGDFPAEQIDALREYRDEGGAPVHILAVAAGPEAVPPVASPPAPPLDEARMRDAARAGGGSLLRVTPDASDVGALARAVTRGLRDAPAQEDEQWRDMGWWLLPLLGLVLLPFFRRGGAVAL